MPRNLRVYPSLDPPVVHVVGVRERRKKNNDAAGAADTRWRGASPLVDHLGRAPGTEGVVQGAAGGAPGDGEGKERVAGNDVAAAQRGERPTDGG